MSEQDVAQALSQSVRIARSFTEVVAVGLSGSYARKAYDNKSDLDICIFCRKRLPPPKRRQNAYRSLGISDIGYFDVDFEVSRSDGLCVAGVQCGFIWMSLRRVKTFLRCLISDYDCDEFLPGGLLYMKSLFDPNGVMDGLKTLVPTYSEDRAKYRIKSNLEKGYFAIHVLGWLEKAALRNDCFSFSKNMHELLDYFFTALFALNREWLSDEKRLLQRIGTFRLAPEQAARRLESVLMHQGKDAGLTQCLEDIKKLFGDLASIANREYPGLELPKAWD